MHILYILVRYVPVNNGDDNEIDTVNVFVSAHQTEDGAYDALNKYQELHTDEILEVIPHRTAN